LYVLGLHFNGVPESLDSFLLWTPDPAKKSLDLWERAAALYERVLETNPSYKTRISLGRTYGFLGRWRDAAECYAKLFDQEALVEKGTKKFNQTTLKEKPQLIFGYLEWGVAELQTAVAEKDKDRYTRSFGIFDTVCFPANTDKT